MTGAQPTVLIVDDSEGVCLALSMMLEKSGYKTHAAHNLAEGLRLPKEHHFDLILVDRVLGSDSGLDLAERLLQITPGTRIIVMSGSVTVREEMDQHPTIRNLLLLQKPFSRQELLDCIHTALGNAA